VKKKMFCLPYAGASARVYLQWKKYLNNDIEIIPLELAGRGSRFGEKAYESFDEMVDDVYYAFMNELVKDEGKSDYAIFGHSMGCWITYELCKRIFKSCIKNPIHIIFSGNKPPYYKCKEKKIYDLPKEEFIQELLKIDKSAKKILEDEEFGDIFLRILRNDYYVIENYICDKEKFIMNCDISIFNGIDDDINNKELLAWTSCAKGSFNIYNFEGNHFFINESIKDVVDRINKILCSNVKEEIIYGI